MNHVLEKLCKIQQELKAPKNLKNNFGNYMYRNAESILEAFKPYERKYNVILTVSDEVVLVGERYYIKATASFKDIETGGCECVTAFARESKEKKGMDESQITGTASSYARKYALNGLLLLDDTKDSDTDENTLVQQGGWASEPQKNMINKLCTDNNVNLDVLCKKYKVVWDKMTGDQAGQLLNLLKKQLGDS